MQHSLAGYAAPFAVQRTDWTPDEPAKLSSNLTHASPNAWVRFFPFPCYCPSISMLLVPKLNAFEGQTQCFWWPNSMLLESKLNAFEKLCSGCFVTNCYSVDFDIAASEVLRRGQRLQGVIRLFVVIAWGRGLV